MSEFLAGKAVRKVAEGIVVERPSALPPQGARGDLFNIVGGRVVLKAIIGEVTTNIGAVANNTKLEYNPADAARGDMCNLLNITGAAAGTILSITGTPANNLVAATNVALRQATQQVLKPGVIELNCAGASVTGAIKWTVLYVPIDDGAYVEVA